MEEKKCTRCGVVLTELDERYNIDGNYICKDCIDVLETSCIRFCKNIFKCSLESCDFEAQRILENDIALAAILKIKETSKCN